MAMRNGMGWQSMGFYDQKGLKFLLTHMCVCVCVFELFFLLGIASPFVSIFYGFPLLICSTHKLICCTHTRLGAPSLLPNPQANASQSNRQSHNPSPAQPSPGQINPTQSNWFSFYWAICHNLCKIPNHLYVVEYFTRLLSCVRAERSRAVKLSIYLFGID